MARVLVSAVIGAPADRVWERIGRFDAVADWLPFVASSPIEDGGDPRRVGCVRVVTQEDGLVFRERLSPWTTGSAATPTRSWALPSRSPTT